MGTGTKKELGLPNAVASFSLNFSRLTPPLRLSTVPLIDVIGRVRTFCAMASWNCAPGCVQRTLVYVPFETKEPCCVKST